MRQIIMSTAAAVLGLAICVSGGYLYGYGGENSIEGFEHEKYSHPHYTFKYSVHDPHTGDHKKQWETREGDVVKGSYSLMEPDGTIRQVDYIADKIHGFRAIVKKKGKPIESVEHIETPKYSFHVPEHYLQHYEG